MRAVLFAPEILSPWDVRHVPLPPPTQGIFDCPSIQLCINEFWLSHIDGLLERFLYRDAWLGTDEEIDRAIGEVNKLLAAFKECNMSCCCGSQIVLHRVSPDGTQMEVSYDNGVTWQPDPNNLPFATPAMPAPVTSGVSATKCDAASNGLQHIKDLVAKQSDEMGTNNTIAGIAIAVAIFIIGLVLAFVTEGFAIPAWVDLLIGVMSQVFAAGKADFDAYWTSGVYDTILCAFYCNIRADGTFDDAGFSAVISRLNAALPDSPHKRWLVQILSVMKLPGLNNICSYGNAANSDCSSCECPDCLFDYDFRISSHQFSLSAHRGSWVSGQGWESTDLTVDTFNYYTCMVEVTIPDGCTTPFLHWELFYADVSGVPGAQVLGKYQFLQDDGTGNIVWIDNGWNNGGATNTEHSTTVGTPGYLGTTFYGVRIQITNLGVNGGSFIRRLQLKATNP